MHTAHMRLSPTMIREAIGSGSSLQSVFRSVYRFQNFLRSKEKGGRRSPSSYCPSQVFGEVIVWNLLHLCFISMFKKPVEAKLHQRLSGADRRKLRRTIKDRFSHASDADIDVLLPPKADITVAKLHNRALVYGVEGGRLMFFDVDGRGTDLFPTVYALWEVPALLPAFVLKSGEVSRYVINGADLMFPGISVSSDGLPPFLAGEAWAVKVPGNGAPIAVGITTMSSSEAMKAGLRGKALRIIHFYRDLLWDFADGRYVPNAGFLEDVVNEDPNIPTSSQVPNLCEEVPNPELNGIDSHHEVRVESFASEAGEPAATVNLVDEREDSVSLSTNLVEMDLTEEEAISESSMEVGPTLSVDDMDRLVDRCLLQALHKAVKDTDLPIPGSTLWSGYILPCRPEGVTLDIKKSSYKKVSKLLQSKSLTGLISVKEDKYSKDVILLSINRGHVDYTSFKPEKHQCRRDDHGSNHTVSEGRLHDSLQVEEIYKPSAHVIPVIASIGVDKAKLFSASEVSDIAFKYVEKQNLVKLTNKAVVVLDAILCDALYKGTIKKGASYPTEIHKKDLASTFISRMNACHRVSRGDDSVVRKGAIKAIQIMTERRQGNKKVTRVSGLEIFLVDPGALASELQKKFACSTSVAELPGKKGLEVLVQGGVIEDVAKHLIENMGIPKKYIEVLDKTKK